MPDDKKPTVSSPPLKKKPKTIPNKVIDKPCTPSRRHIHHFPPAKPN